MMAECEATAVLGGVTLLNQYLIQHVPGRSLEAIKGRRRRADYRNMVQERVEAIIALRDDVWVLERQEVLGLLESHSVINEDGPSDNGAEDRGNGDIPVVPGVLPGEIALEYFKLVVGLGVETLSTAAAALVDSSVDPSPAIVGWARMYLKKTSKPAVEVSCKNDSRAAAGRRVGIKPTAARPSPKARNAASYRRNVMEFRRNPKDVLDRIPTGVDGESERPSFDSFMKCWEPVITGETTNPRFPDQYRYDTTTSPSLRFRRICLVQ